MAKYDPGRCPNCGSDDPARWDHHNSINLLGCSDPWHEKNALHRITDRDDGPDLDDLVRLIRYLREHDRPPFLMSDDEHPELGLTVRWSGPGAGTFADPCAMYRIYEDQPDDAVFVGPDGTVYDENREAL